MTTMITSPDIEKYIQDLYPSGEPVFKEMEETAAAINFPLVGPLVGQLLFQLATMIAAKTVFEMGSGFGYSALWFAHALPDDGIIHLTDRAKGNLNRAKTYFTKNNLIHKARFHVGDAIDAIAQASSTFDIIFIDIDKERYPQAFELARSRVNKGGLLIADNLLWFGEVLEKKGTASAEGIKRFNQLLFNDCDFISTLLPIRDGVGVAYKFK